MSYRSVDDLVQRVLDDAVRRPDAGAQQQVSLGKARRLTGAGQGGGRVELAYGAAVGYQEESQEHPLGLTKRPASPKCGLSPSQIALKRSVNQCGELCRVEFFLGKLAYFPPLVHEACPTEPFGYIPSSN